MILSHKLHGFVKFSSMPILKYLWVQGRSLKMIDSVLCPYPHRFPRNETHIEFWYIMHNFNHELLKLYKWFIWLILMILLLSSLKLILKSSPTVWHVFVGIGISKVCAEEGRILCIDYRTGQRRENNPSWAGGIFPFFSTFSN